MKIKRFEFNMFPVNCYVLWDETNEAAVIDAGCFYEEEKQALKGFIKDNHLEVKHLLNTHLHLDHIFGNPFMLKEFGLKAEANQADEYWIENAPKQSRMFGFQLQEQPVPLGKYLHDGDIVTFGHTQLECIHVPGHSPGSLVYYCAADHCMFSMCSSRAASDGQTWPEAISMTSSTTFAAAFLSFPMIPLSIRAMVHRQPSASKRQKTRSSDIRNDGPLPEDNQLYNSY